MFSFFRKKPNQTKSKSKSLSQPSTTKNRYRQEYLNNKEKYETNAAQIREFFPTNYPKSKSEMIDFIVQMRLLDDEVKILQQKNQNEEKQQQFQKKAYHDQVLQNQAIQEEQDRINKERRNRRINTLTRKHGYKSRNNLLANAARQRGRWRESNPNAPYSSLESFVNTPFFEPHNQYTGLTNTNTNANTLSLNSPTSIRNINNTNNFFGGTRRRRRFLRNQ
jgi:hypothetical protein